MNCYCVDASHAIQFGKMPMLALDDYVARTSRDWYKSSSLNSPFDVHLCAYVSLILLMAEWRKTAESGKTVRCSSYAPVKRLIIESESRYGYLLH